MGDRFIRRQVRVLVATAVATAAQLAGDAGEEGSAGGEEALLAACTSGRQQLTAHPAPALGLVFAEAGAMEELSHEWRLEGEPSLSDEELEGLRLMGSEYTEYLYEEDL